jgi:NAD(P)H-dependent flavin oxidoreductase YrpB (nitropropane dioxygenase family)
VDTPFTRLIGCRHPLQQAAMGGIAVPELAGAVARAGGLGMLCEFDRDPPSVRIDQALAQSDSGAVGMGFFGHWLSGDVATYELAAARLRLVEVFWTAPDPAVVERARRAGEARVGWQVGTVDDAKAAEDAGCDLVIAQGVEAGGHVRGSTPRDELLATVRASVDIPVVVAGAIGSAATVAAMLAAGADAVRVGTRFVATVESAAHDRYKQALVDARTGDETVLTTAYSVGWPDAPHRVLAGCVEEAAGIDDDVVGWNRAAGGREPVARHSVLPPTRGCEGRVGAMAMYAGTGVGDVGEVGTAAGVVDELTSMLG